LSLLLLGCNAEDDCRVNEISLGLSLLAQENPEKGLEVDVVLDEELNLLLGHIVGQA
jgi:hypothetical protein